MRNVCNIVLYKLRLIIFFFKKLILAYSTAVSAGHQSKSCSVYKKCEDIFFLEPFYFVTIFLPRSFLKISEGHLQKNFEVENHLNPPKQQNH